MPKSLPAPPAALHSPEQTDREVLLKWMLQVGTSLPDYYEIRYRPAGRSAEDYTCVVRGWPHKHEWLTGLRPNTWYEFGVRAVNDVGHSPWAILEQKTALAWRPVHWRASGQRWNYVVVEYLGNGGYTYTAYYQSVSERGGQVGDSYPTLEAAQEAIARFERQEDIG